MPLGAPPPLAFALSLPGAAPGAAAGCWACARSVMSAAKAATNTGAVRSFMTDDCTWNGGRLLLGQVQQVRTVYESPTTHPHVSGRFCWVKVNGRWLYKTRQAVTG